jgi:hypothetical protein
MADEPKKLFDLMDIETEPTDEQLAELMRYVGEAVRAKGAIGTQSPRSSNDGFRENPSSPYGT